MSDPIPSASSDAENTLPSNAEDRKAAAALSSLHANEIATDGVSGVLPTADQEALGRAMSRLEIAAGKSSGKTLPSEGPKTDGTIKKNAVKVAPADVTLLVDQLDLTRIKATELLKAHDGDVTKAMKSFITPSIQA